MNEIALRLCEKLSMFLTQRREVRLKALRRKPNSDTTRVRTLVMTAGNNFLTSLQTSLAPRWRALQGCSNRKRSTRLSAHSGRNAVET